MRTARGGPCCVQLRGRGLDACGQVVEQLADVATQQGHGGDDDAGDQRCDQCVFDGGDAVFFFDQVFDEVHGGAFQGSVFNH